MEAQAKSNSRNRSEESVTHALEVGSHLHSITEAISYIDERAQQIASATEEQTHVSHDINKSLHNINDVAAQTADNIRQSVAAGESMSRMAAELKALISRFRL
ncbi:hypothetical protein [Nitrincola sp. MINF-07-Sa-05]|uniref:hypothetical protein n=1 Tax=Nitrincola salilacus TaxID=3400273 RepID=UPI003917D1F5